MELNTIEDAFDCLAKKQKLSGSKTQEVINQIEEEIIQALRKIQSANDPDLKLDSKYVLVELNTKLKDMDPISQLENALKELNIALSKYPRLLEKSFNPDISSAYRHVEFDTRTVNHVIANHFYQQGLFDIGDCFINEAEEPESVAPTRHHFEVMHEIVEATKSRNLVPALKLALANSDRLKQNGSDLLLKLHSLHIAELLQKRRTIDAFMYARTYLPPFASTDLDEIQRLMVCFLWTGMLDGSPYPELISPIQWQKVAEELTKQFCRMVGLSYKSPLSVTIAAGFQGLPQLLKMMNLKRQEWQTMKELPYPVQLDREFQFHSIFVCPVSKEQSTVNNPPTLLMCGHVLSKESIIMMSNNGINPFICPLCKSTNSLRFCKQLHF